ncbi:hypothetical protein [Streptomyces sp. 2A115]|uniref:hypothetical protein n=1 Tax=Streptomyces sp. 2A115 TaxID=3457439 RepID=UPI003FCF312E
MILIAGTDKSGRSHEAAAGTASDLVGMSYWIQVGGSSNTADYYGRIPGARYEIAEHDGSHADICDAIRWASAQPPHNGKRNMIVFDDSSALWDMLCDEVALVSRKRAERRAQANGRRTARLDDPYVDEDRDLWVNAKDRWGEVLWLLRQHPGPVVMVARQEVVTAYENDKPTRHTTRRLKAEKNLSAAVDAVVELHGIGEGYVTGVHTMEYTLEAGRQYRFAGIDHLLRKMGYEDSAPTRQSTESRPWAYLNEQRLQQQPAPPAPAQHPGLTGPQAVELIHQALTNESDPEACLHDVREYWGKRTLAQVRTTTKLWGEMDADALITRSLEYVKEEASKRKQAEGSASEQTGPSPAQSAEPERQDQTRAHQENEEPDPSPEDSDIPVSSEPPVESEGTPPPPPDPEAEDPPPGESPEDTSAAEEPQDVPAAPPPAARKIRKRSNEDRALKALNAEADVQARIRMMTVGEHLGPISEEGDPPMTVLRDYLQKHRPAIIAQLEQEGQTELAAYYREVTVDPQIQQRFASYFAGVPAG